MRKIFPLFLSLVICLSPLGTAAQDKPAPADGREMNELEKEFEKKMSGVTLVGRFSTDGKEDKPPKQDKYVISKVTKVGDDVWLFGAQLGDGKPVLPLPLQVKWAGDTPVITVTKFPIPKMGTYTARVVIYGDRYAGTWEDAKGGHGGHLWGRLERAKQPDEAREKPAP